MKKLIALIVSFILAINTAGIIVFSQDDQTAEELRVPESVRVLRGLGVANFSDEEAKELITRGEFAFMLANALKINSEINQYSSATSFGKPEETNGFSDNEVKQIFADVFDSHPFFAEINAVGAYKLMNGSGDAFRPDDELKYEEAVKTFVSCLGYESKALIEGGWFFGYHKVAKKLGILLDGKNEGDVLSKTELCEMFYKALDVEINDVKSVEGDSVYYDSNENRTFLTEYMKIGYAEGRVTEVENSTLTSKKQPDGTIKVDGKTIRNSQKIETNKFLGRYAKAFYDLNDNSDELLFILYSSKDEVFTVSAEDANGVKNGVLTYFKNGKARQYNIKNLPVIYNGTAKPSFDDSLFSFEFGDITVTEKGKNDVVIVRDYRDIVISAITEKDKTVYGKDESESVVFDDDFSVNIFDENGKRTDFEALTADVAITYLNGENYKEVYILSAAKTAVLNSFSQSKKIMTADGEEYDLSEAVAKTIDDFGGKKIKFWQNIFGVVFKVEQSGKTNETYGYLTGVSKGGSLENCKARIFDSEGVFCDLFFADKVTLYKADAADSVRLSGNEINEAKGTNGYKGFVSYKLNSKGEISMLQIPLKNRSLKTEGDGRLWTKTVNQGSGSSDHLANVYRPNTQSIGVQVFFDASVKIFSVPTSGDTKDYKMLNYNSFYSLLKFKTLSAYYSDFEDPIPEAVVVNDWTEQNSTHYLSTNFAVVTKLWEGKNEKGERRVTATVVDVTGAEAEIFSDEITTDSTGADCTAFDAAEVDFASDKRTVEEGDIIAYTTVYGKTDEVTCVMLIYDCSVQNIAGGKRGYLAMAYPGSDQFYIDKEPTSLWNAREGAENISEIISCYYSASNSLTRQNPLWVEPDATNGELFKKNGYRDYGGGRKLFLGYVTKKTDAFVRLTTQDLSVAGTVPSENGIPSDVVSCPAPGSEELSCYGIYWEEWCRLVNSFGYLLNIEYYDNGIYVRKGTPEDILSYENAKNDASRILSDQSNKKYYIINDYRTK